MVRREVTLDAKMCRVYSIQVATLDMNAFRLAVSIFPFGPSANLSI